MLNQPWPLTDVVSKLLHEKDYDGHGYEEMHECLEIGRKWLKERENKIG